MLEQQAEAASPEIPMIAATADLMMLKHLQRNISSDSSWSFYLAVLRAEAENPKWRSDSGEMPTIPIQIIFPSLVQLASGKESSSTAFESTAARWGAMMCAGFPRLWHGNLHAAGHASPAEVQVTSIT